MSDKVYLVTSGVPGEDSYQIERAYFDGDEAQRFATAYNEATGFGDYRVEEHSVGPPSAEYDGPCFEGFWVYSGGHPDWPLSPTGEDFSQPRETFEVSRRWSTGPVLPPAEVSQRWDDKGKVGEPKSFRRVDVRGSSQQDVQQLLREQADYIMSRVPPAVGG